MKNKTFTLIVVFIFCLFNSNISIGQIKVKSNGYVGIATTNPLYRLHVNGTARATEWRIINASTRLQRGNGNSLRVRTASGYTDIGAQNGSWTHFRTDRAAFWFDKRVEIYNHLYPYNNNSYYLGSFSKRWNRAYITSIWRTNEYALSDLRTKENIRPIGNAMEILMQLDGKYYDYKASVFEASDNHPSFDEQIITGENEVDEASQNATNKTVLSHDGIDRKKLKSESEILRKNKVGFIAQDVNKVLPGAVFYDEEADLYSMSYDQIIPLLVEAVKEQQKQIQLLKAKLDQ